MGWRKKWQMKRRKRKETERERKTLERQKTERLWTKETTGRTMDAGRVNLLVVKTEEKGVTTDEEKEQEEGGERRRGTRMQFEGKKRGRKTLEGGRKEEEDL